MTSSASITLDTNDIIGEVHDHLYGANLEHLGQSIYGGHWAEMLRDRKFAGFDAMYTGLSEGLQGQNPGFGVVLPWQAVNPSPGAVLFVHDNTTFYTGKQSQRITIREADDKDHGVRQEGLYLESGRSYQVRLVLKGEGQTFTVQLGDQSWVIQSLDDDWHTYEQTLTASETQPNGALTMTIRVGNAWIGCASVMPAENMDGHRPDVVAAIKEWTPTFLRWPGGNFVSAYHWLDGIGDRDQRPSYLDPAWTLWESNDVGTDEFMALCEIIGTEPILTVNIGNGTPQEAAAWVAYCNADATDEYGAMRAANGHAEPYNVKTWFVGNEQFGNWQVGNVDAETYARLYLEFARAMRAVDPDLNLIAVGVPTDLYGHWNELVLKAAAPEIDELSVHFYSIRTEKWDDPPPGDVLYLPKVAAAHEVALMLDETLAIMDAHAEPPVPLAFDEWNTYVGAKPPAYIEDYNIGDALYAGVLMNACIQRADRIKMSAIYNLINVMGNYIVAPLYAWSKLAPTRGDSWIATGLQEPIIAPSVWKNPTTLVMELLTHHRGPQAIRCEVDCPTINTPAVGNLPAFDDVPLVDAAATYDPMTGATYLSVVNRDADHSIELTIQGLERAGDSQLFLVTGDSTLATNTGTSPQRVTIEATTWPGGQASLTLPAHSFAMLVMAYTAR